MRRVRLILLAMLFVGLVSPAPAQLPQIPVERVPADNLPMRFECGDDEYPLVVLVRNPSFIPRIIGVEAVFVNQDGRIVETIPAYLFDGEVAAGERALLARCVFLPRGVSLGTIRLRAAADDWRVDRPLLLPFWLSVEEPAVETWQSEGGYHLRARASFLAHNRRRSDTRLVGQVRFYNAQGYQVAVCSFEGRVLVSVATRLGCAVSGADLIPDTPTRAKVEVLRIE